MTRGALIFAFNNESIDYVSMASWCAKNIQRHLGIPTALVTDEPVSDRNFDHVIVENKITGNGRFFSDFNSEVMWYNQNRPDAYDLSPWDETLVLDADYIVASDQMLNLFNGPDFSAHRWAYDITGTDNFHTYNHFGRSKMPMWWATIMYFRRDESVKMIFDCMKMVRDNWKHYREIYGNSRGNFRNDHALSIALNLVNGHVQPAGIPWSLASVIPSHHLEQTGIDSYRIEFTTDKGATRWVEIKGQDFHAMGKRYLGAIVAG